MPSTVFTVRTPRGHDAAALQELIERRLLETTPAEEITVNRHTQDEYREQKSDHDLRRDLALGYADANVSNDQLLRMFNWIKTGSFQGPDNEVPKLDGSAVRILNSEDEK